MVQVRVNLFRAFYASCENRPLECFDLLRAQELFAFLLLGRERPHRREVLVELLWGESPPPQAKKNLRQLLWQLRAGLHGQIEERERQVLVADAEWVYVHPEAGILLDVAEFEHAYEQVEDVAGDALSAEQAQALKQAVDLYAGDLLEGWYQDWCLFERERLQNMYLLILDKLMSYAEVQGTYESGVQYGLRALRCDRAREITYRRLMRLSYLAGDRTGALRIFARCQEALQSELGVEPTKRTVALARAIEANRPLDAGTAVQERVARPSPGEEPADLLLSCRKVKRTLGTAQAQLQQTMRLIEMLAAADNHAE